MKKLSKNHWICLGFLALLFSLSLFERKIKKEVYPSLMFPSFAGAPKMKNAALFPVTEVFGVTMENEKVKINKDSLFHDTSLKHPHYVIVNIIRKGSLKKFSEKESRELEKYMAETIRRNIHRQLKSISFVTGKKSFNYATRAFNTQLYDEKSFTISLN